MVDRDEAVLVVTINRPEVRNAINLETATAIAAALTELDTDDSLLAAVITGAGGHFCAGMDLKAFALDGVRPHVPGRGFAGLVRQPPRKPLVAAVEGYALAGGFEIVLACDVVVAAQGAQFGLPEVKRGLVAVGGGLFRLPERVPRPLAMRLALTGEAISAERAFEVGLVTDLAEKGHALESAVRLARTIAGFAAGPVQVTKRIIDESGSWPAAERWDRQEAIAGPLMRSPEARQGAAAFTHAERAADEGHGGSESA
jgi:enoyl-CoA hydratase